MYQLLAEYHHPITGDAVVPQSVKRLSDNAFIPFDPANTDSQQFKKDIAEGKTLQDADGVDMTADAIKTFMETLP